MKLIWVAPAALVVAVVLALGPRLAHAAVYWGAFEALGAANLDGSMASVRYPPGAANQPRPTYVCGVAVGGGSLYWADQSGNAIGRAEFGDPAGAVDPAHERVSINLALISGVPEPCGIAVDSNHLYWAGHFSGTIGRANLDGTGVEREFITGLEYPCGLAVDAGHLYWGEAGPWSIARANLDGSGVKRELVRTDGESCGVATDGTHLYWSDRFANEIGRANLDGSEPLPGFIKLATPPCGVTVADGHIYWAKWLGIGSMIGRANLDGTGVQDFAVGPYYSGSCGVAADSRVFAVPPPPPPTPSGPITIGKVTRVGRGPALRLQLTVPGTGELAVSAPQVGWALDKGPEPPAWRGGPFTWSLKVWPGGKSAVGRRIQRQLVRQGKSAITLHLAYQQAGHTTIEVERRLVFHRRARPHRS